ncbi:MAG: YggT family protein [Candidatus Adiutrix sp.]|jgi:YggT family protein|nr:YggT family protein [Candidatus Adiutrix sp.]
MGIIKYCHIDLDGLKGGQRPLNSLNHTVQTIMNSFLAAIGQFIFYAVSIYVWIIVIRVLLTWINPNPYTPVMRFLSRATDPLLNWARRTMPLTLGGLDFSPILAILALHLLGAVVGRWLWNMGLGAPAMILLPQVAMALINLLYSITWLLIVIMALRLIMSLVHPSPYNMLVQIIFGVSEPILAPLRRLFPPGPGGLDLRPLVVLILTILIQQMVLGSLAGAVLGWAGGLLGAP